MKTFTKDKVKLPLIVLFVSVTSTHGAEIPQNSQPYLQHFREFTNDLIAGAKETTEATTIKPGLDMTNPIGIGILLAHINERVWNVSTKGIPDALHTPENRVASEYAQLYRQFRRRQFRISNTVYSRFANLTRPMAFDQFMTHIIKLDFTNQSAEFLDSFTSFVDGGTKGHLNNEIVPKLLYRKVFENNTVGSFFNTLYYRGMWENSWTSVGDRPFNYDSLVPFLETRGEFKTAQNSNITAIMLNIQGQGKSLIFFKANSHMEASQLRKEFLNLKANESLWQLQNLTVQIPAINATNMARHHLGLSFMGINETFCQNNVSDPLDYYYSQQPITQGNHFEISSTYVEIASASGTLVNYQNDDPNLTDQEFGEDYYDDDYEVLDTERDGVDDIEEHVNSRQFKNRFRRSTVKTLGGCGRPDDFAQSTSNRTSNPPPMRNVLVQGKSDNSIMTFDTPFSWAMVDGEIGEVFYGHVSSLCQFNKATNAIFASPTHAWLHDVFKVAFWKCIS